MEEFPTQPRPPRTTLLGDDVVFMYPPTDPATYAAYGCTVLAWGGAAAGTTVRDLAARGVHGTGSMWCLTAGAERLHQDADLRDAVCRDLDGRPIPVWWLFDTAFEGTPNWFGCTNHPAFRAFVRQRVAEEMRGGAPGLHVDDHLGTAHTVAFLNGCFCDHCMRAFAGWLAEHAGPEARATAGVTDWAGFDYRALLRRHAPDDAAYRARLPDVPLRDEFLDCQLRLAAANVQELGALAAQIVGRPVTLSANAALPEPPHLAVVPHVSHVVGEVPHHAEHGTARLHEAVHAYRMAEAAGKPIAATARGADWAWVKDHGVTSLVKIWIALGYAMGQRLMAPHRQWCFTPEKGSHWYDAPPGVFEPLYRFVRACPHLFAATRSLPPLATPVGPPPDLATTAGRAAFARHLGHAEPRRTGPAWVFDREAADGARIVHLLNLDYHAEVDRVTACRDLVVPLEVTAASTATLYAYDAEPMTLPVRATADGPAVTVPALRTWAVMAIE